jgi:hypothetical protein
MFQTIEITIDNNGVIHPLEPRIKLPSGRALLTLLKPIVYETELLSEQSLAKEWLNPEEDKAWAHLINR